MAISQKSTQKRFPLPELLKVGSMRNCVLTPWDHFCLFAAVLRVATGKMSAKTLFKSVFNRNKLRVRKLHGYDAPDIGSAHL